MSLPRFFVPDVSVGAPDVALPPDEARHLTRVLRLAEGDDVLVFDGRGHEFRARVTHTARDSAHVELIERIEAAAEPRVRLTLAQAILKPDAMDDVMRDATMVGVSRIIPIISAHVVARSSGRAVDRWRRVAVASAKQCRRAVVPDITTPQPLDEWLAEPGDDLRVMLVEPAIGSRDPGLGARGSGAAHRDLHALGHVAASSATILVGPEGGWSAEERERAESAEFLPVTLGRLTFRADATPIVGIVLLRFVLRDL